VDLSGVAPAEREQRLAALLASERAQGFELSAPPLLRFTLVRCGGHGHPLGVGKHQRVNEGWAMAGVVVEVLARDRGEALSPVPAYREYLGWLARQDREAARAAWRDALAGLAEATHVAPVDPRRPARVPAQHGFALSAELTRRLVAQARRQGLTLN